LKEAALVSLGGEVDYAIEPAAAKSKSFSVRKPLPKLVRS
jgi:hypothetical protein